MIERSAATARVEIANRGDSFIDCLAGNEARGDFLERAKTSGKVFEFFLTGEIEQRASREHRV